MSKIEIKIKVDDATTYTFLEDDNLIEGLALTRKMDADITALNSDIECGEVNITFSNLFNEFNVTSHTSPFSKLKNGQELRVFTVSESGSYTLFTGYIADFTAPTSTKTQSCTVRAVDRLHMLLNSDITLNSDIQVNSNMSLFDYISILFSSYGVSSSDLELEEDLRQIFLQYSILSGKTLAEQLNEICKSVDCYIYVNRVGRIIVKLKEIMGTPVKTFTREDNENYLSTSEYGYSLFSSYNALKVGYVAAKLSEVKCLLSIENQAVKPGQNKISNFELGISNCYELDNIRVSSTSNTLIEEVSATSSTISFTLNNPTGADDIVDIKVYGKTIDTANSFVLKTVEAEQIEQSLDVSSILIQSKAHAEALAEKLYIRTSETIPYIKADVEIQNFCVDLSYIVRVVDSEADLDFTGYIHSIDVEYDGQGYSYYTLGIKALYKDGVNNG